MFRLAPSKALGRLPNNTNFSFVFRRSISTEPLLQNPDHFRVLRISNVPSGTPVSVLLDQIRVDGPIENIRYNEADNSATLSLLDAQAAKKLMNESDSININGQTLSFEFAPAELQHKLSASLLGSIGGYFTTRAVEIELRPGVTEGWYRTEVERLCGPVEIERIVLDNTNSKAFLYFTDLLEAVKAKQIFKNNGMRADKVRSVMDPCDFNNSEDARETHTVIIKDVENGPVRKLLSEHISGASGGFLSNVPLNSLFRSKDNVVMLDFINSSDARQFVQKFSHPQWSAELDPRPRNATTYKVRLCTRLGATRRLLISGPNDQIKKFIYRGKIERWITERHLREQKKESTALLVMSTIGNSLAVLHPLNYDPRLIESYSDLTITFGAEPQPEGLEMFKEESTDLLLPWTGRLQKAISISSAP